MKFDAIEARPMWHARMMFTTKAIASFLAITLLLLGLSTYSNITNQSNSGFNSISGFMSTQNNIQISVYNEYTHIQGQPGNEYPWITMPVVEPYRTTYLEAVLTTTDSSVDYDDITYFWTIGGDSIKYEGQKIEYQFQKIVYYDISVIQVQKSTNQILQSTMQEVVCRYVRREIRALTEDDREAYFDAVEVVYNTPSLEGKQLYGDLFVNVQTLIAIHNNRAGDIICDHMHDGFGFMNSHAALTLTFEISLQQVNPIVTVPYWDYTIDTVEMTETGSIDSFKNSIVFDDNWLGEASPPSKVVTRGRFAYSPVKAHMFNSTTTLSNAYGFLRAPWNQNKIPYVTRNNGMCGFPIKNIATCDEHYKLLQLKTFAEFMRNSQYGPHGTIHIAIGGMWGADWKGYLENWGYNLSNTGAWDNAIFTKLKNMFRARILECPEYCSADTPNSNCKCTCPHFDSYLKDSDELTDLVYQMMQGTVDEEYYEYFLYLLCNKFDDLAPVLGDQLESASPGDVSFWPIHPTMERLFQWKRLNGFESMDWKDDSAWSFWDGLSPAVGHCEGHNLDDTVAFQDLFAPYLPGVYTNSDFIHFTNPEKDYTPYIYDKFSWAHCAEQGYPLDLMG